MKKITIKYMEETHSKKVEEEIQNYLQKDKNRLEDEDLYDKPNKKKKFIIIGLVVFLAILAFAALSFYAGHNSFSNERVTVAIQTQNQIGSGEEMSIEIDCKNDNNVDLRNVQLEIAFPEHFILKSNDKTISQNGPVYIWNVNNISAHGTEKIRIYGKIIGQLDEDKILKGTLRYKPSNFNYTFQTESAKTIKISSIPVELSINFPQSANDTDISEFTFTYKNKSGRDFSKARLEMNFPENFVFSSSDPLVSKKDGQNNSFIFEQENLTKGTELSIKINGTVQGKNDKETVTAVLSLLEENNEMTAYAIQEKDINVEKPDISISQTINGNTEYAAGKNEDLHYQITFKNQSGKELRGLELKTALSGNFDLSSIKADKGTVKGNQIIWSAINIPQLGILSADGEDSVSFTVKVKDIFPISKQTDKNFLLSSSATISSFGSTDSAGQEKIIGRNDIEARVKSFPIVNVKGYFNDDGRIQNGGALPPQVGQATYYTIHWSVMNVFNDTENVRITSILPRGIKLTGKYIDSTGNIMDDQNIMSGNAVQNAPTNQIPGQTSGISQEKLYYDQGTNQVIWEIPVLKANDGILTSAKEIVFQIEAAPADEDAGKPMNIMSDTVISGYDSFSGQIVTNTANGLTTDLTDDYSISSDEAIVKGR